MLKTLHEKMPAVNADIILLAIGVTLIALGIYQERKAEKALEELRFWRSVLRGFNDGKKEKNIKS